jgi:hypothetical protein
MRRQKEFRGKSCSKPEGREVSSDVRLRIFTKSVGKKNFAGKDLHFPKGRRFQAIFGLNCSRDAEAKGDVRKAYSKAEGREVSGDIRFELFAGGGGKGKDAVKSIYTPKGRAFQQKIAWVCSFCKGKQGLGGMCSWGNHGCPSNSKAKPVFSSKA